MKTLLQKVLLENWPRKALALLLAAIIWTVTNHSLTATRNISNIPVRLINIPHGKTIEGMQANGRLTKKVTLTLVGNKTILDELTPYDLEIVIDASNKPDEWMAVISKKNLVSLNPEIDISKGISRVFHPSFTIRFAHLVTEKIPIIITQPIGEAPRGYQYLDIWPYKLMLTVSGPEETVSKLKAKEHRITFNLNDISKAQLDALSSVSSGTKTDVVSLFVPDQWKQIHLPLVSDSPIEIDDPQSKALRIDFVRCNLLPIDKTLPISLFYPPETLDGLNPETIKTIEGPIVKKLYGSYMISAPLFANGVDRLFLQTVSEMLEMVIIISDKERNLLEWSIQFINPRLLEDRYVSTLMSDVSDEDARLLQPHMREEYLRNRFRSYMNRFQLFTGDDVKFDLNISLNHNTIEVKEAVRDGASASVYSLFPEIPKTHQ